MAGAYDPVAPTPGSPFAVATWNANLTNLATAANGIGPTQIEPGQIDNDKLALPRARICIPVGIRRPRTSSFHATATMRPKMGGTLTHAFRRSISLAMGSLTLTNQRSLATATVTPTAGAPAALSSPLAFRRGDTIRIEAFDDVGASSAEVWFFGTARHVAGAV